MTTTFEATPIQEQLLETVVGGDARLIGFGGGIRSTKTWGSLATIVALCRIFPRSRWTVVRKDLERIKKSTIPSFEKLAALANGFLGPLNRSEWTCKCRNGSEILFFGENIDKDPELLRWHGFETNGFLLEEADELSERSFVKAIERAGTWLVADGEQPSPYVLCTFNPCAGWPRRRFYTPWRDETIQSPYAFIPATAADNPFLSDEQKQAWKEMPEAEYRRFVLGDWEMLSGAYYDTLSPEHLINRDALPTPLPPHWHYWGSFDWGYSHWAVMGAWATDSDGVSYLLNSVWLRKLQDDELAVEFRKDLPDACLREVYAGHDCWNKVKAHAASGKSTFETFAERGVYLVPADPDLVNSGRAVNNLLKRRDQRARAYIVRTKGNLRVFDQLGEIVPHETDIRKPKKIDADQNGIGGDDGADMFRYGLATHVLAYGNPKVAVESDDVHPGFREDGKRIRRPTGLPGRTQPARPGFVPRGDYVEVE